MAAICNGMFAHGGVRYAVMIMIKTVNTATSAQHVCEFAPFKDTLRTPLSLPPEYVLKPLTHFPNPCSPPAHIHRPFCATFLNFIGYALGAVRVSALSNMGIVYIMTHDSIGLGT